MVKSIGVSNYNSAQLAAVNWGSVKPTVNQCHMSIGSHDDDTIAYCAKNGTASNDASRSTSSSSFFFLGFFYILFLKKNKNNHYFGVFVARVDTDCLPLLIRPSKASNTRRTAQCDRAMGRHGPRSSYG